MAETKKPPDYTNTAENLINPPEVKELLDKFRAAMALSDKLKQELQEKNEALMGEIEAGNRVLQQLNQDIREMVEAQGSYQDIEAGDYAVRYRRISKSYDVAAFKRNYPDFAPAVVTETLNVKALEGLIRGKLLTEEALKLNKILIETPTYAFFIR